MKFLNLDKLNVGASRKLILKGKGYPIQEMTVENFIEINKVAEEIENASIADQVSATCDMIIRSVPTLPRQELVGLRLAILQTIVAFVRGDDVEGTEEAEEAAEGAEAKK